MDYHWTGTTIGAGERERNLIGTFKCLRAEADNKHLLDKLKAEAPGILNWLIKGCLEWQRVGLAPPEEVERATMQYRDEEDILLQFVNDACLTGPEFMAGASALYDHYRKWMQDNGLKPMSGQKFGRRMGERYHKKRIGSVWQYHKVGILNPTMPDI